MVSLLHELDIEVMLLIYFVLNTSIKKIHRAIFPHSVTSLFERRMTCDVPQRLRQACCGRGARTFVTVKAHELNNLHDS
jgi:hypothetical protein